MDPTWAAWTEEAILIGQSGANGSPEIQFLPHRTPTSLRYWVRLFRRFDRLLLRSCEGAVTHFDAADSAGGFYPILGWPEQLESLPIYRVVPLADGGFAGLPEEEHIFLWRVGQIVASRTLPPRFRARALDQDERGRLYVAGSIVTQRLRSMEHRHAFAVSSDDGLSWQIDEKDHSRLATAWHSVLSGGQVEYRTVTAADRHLVLSLETGELGEESTLVFVQDPRGRWTSEVFRHDVFRAAVAVGDGAIEIVSHRGNGVLVQETGGRKRLYLVPRIARALASLEAPPPAGARYEILGVDASEGAMAVLVSIQAPAAQGFVRFGEAILAFGANVDRVVHLQRAPAPEIITVCFPSDR